MKSSFAFTGFAVLCWCSCATLDATGAAARADAAAPPERLSVQSLVEERDAEGRELAGDEGLVLLARVGVATSAAVLAGVGAEIAATNAVGHAIDPKFHDLDARVVGSAFAAGGLAVGIGSVIFGVNVDHTDTARARLSLTQQRLDHAAAP